MNLFRVLLLAALAMQARAGHAQSIAIDGSQTVGYSSEEVASVATQVRAFGDLKGGVRFMLEGAWGARSATKTDVFSGAYPYGNEVQVIEAYGERMFQPGNGIVGIRAGRFRTPFGISSASDHAYSGFLRAPLIRYDGYYGLSNNYLEHGINLIAGVPRLSLETSVGAPADTGTVTRRRGVDTVVRAQGTIGSAIIGVSYIRTQPYQPASYARGRARFGGIDVRWMSSGIQVRGEWITGHPFNGTSTAGGYADLLMHRPSMGPITAVLRAERLGYRAGYPFAMFAQRYTGGARIRVLDRIAVQIGLVHQTAALPQRRPTALDLAVTYSVRAK